MPKSRALARFSTHCRWTSHEARAALEALERSGLGVAAFAAREGLDPQRLYFWRRRLRADAADAIAPTFVEVMHSGTGHERVEVVLRSGRILRVAETIDGADLRRIADALDEAVEC